MKCIQVIFDTFLDLEYIIIPYDEGIPIDNILAGKFNFNEWFEN